MHLTGLKYGVDTVAQRYLSVVFLDAVKVALDGVAHQVVVLLPSSGLT
jgi:hypothetical protein